MQTIKVTKKCEFFRISQYESFSFARQNVTMLFSNAPSVNADHEKSKDLIIAWIFEKLGKKVIIVAEICLNSFRFQSNFLLNVANFLRYFRAYL